MPRRPDERDLLAGVVGQGEVGCGVTGGEAVGHAIPFSNFSSTRPRWYHATLVAQTRTNNATRPKPTYSRSRLPAQPRPGTHSRGELHEQECADREGHRDRQDRDGEVVVDLADRLEEGPRVGPRHQDPVEGVEEDHAGGEEHREGEDGVPRQREGSRPAGEHQQRDLRGGVEAEPHQETDGVEVAGAGDPLGRPLEDPRQEAAVVQVVLEVLLVERPRPQVAERVHDADERAEVHQADDDEERAGGDRAHRAERALEGGPVVLHRVGEGAYADRQQEAEPEDDARVTHPEPEARRRGGGAVPDQLAGRVVDGRDVVGVEGVAGAEQEGGDAQADTEDTRAAHVEPLGRDDRDQHSPAERVEHDDDRRHAGDVAAVGRGEGAQRIVHTSMLLHVCCNKDGRPGRGGGVDSLRR